MIKRDFLIFDTETSGLYKKKLNVYDPEQAWVVQLAGIFTDSELDEKSSFSVILKPPLKESTIEKEAAETHGITLNRSKAEGLSQYKVHGIIKPVFFDKIRLVGHNLGFDYKFLHRYPKSIEERKSLKASFELGICTMRTTSDYCKLPPTESMLKAAKKYKNKWKNWSPQKYKSPKLEELYKILFDEELEGAHDALTDARATARSLKELVKRGIIKL